jgi:UDPglucose 6-dehydrogenase
MNYKVAIIGFGFVGKAVNASYRGIDSNYIIDPNLSNVTGSYKSIKDVDVVYVCVPSPQKEDGSCDTSILSDVLYKLKSVNYKGVVISKVTAPPSFYTTANEFMENLVYVPEFLVAKTAINDYLSTRFHVIGGNNKTYIQLAKTILQNVFPSAVFYSATIEEASMMKYTINSFLATKVVFMNELKILCDKTNIDYNKVEKLVLMDKRIGNSHTQVPGPDNHFGFGGACFPKDTNALLTYAKENDILLSVLNSAIEKNKLIR